MKAMFVHARRLRPALVHHGLVAYPHRSFTPLLSLRSRHYSSDTSSSQTPYEDFFKHTSYRWIHKEAEELAKRYLRFNVDELKAAAAKAAGAQSVTSMRKFMEGEFNKAFLLTLDNGKEVVARLPLAKAGPSQFVTASEVATMDFVRSRLDIPTPRVLAWASDQGHNPVGSAYIIMEKAEGVELDEVWKDLPDKLKYDVITKLVAVEKKFTKSIGGGYGALYYRGDVDHSESRDLYVDREPDKEFVLGPATPTSFWRDGRAEMLVDRGPWDSTLSYILAIANKERAWISAHAVHNEFPGPFDPPTQKQTPEAHLALLDRLIAVAAYLVPSDPEFLEPTLTHRDLNTGNIFLSKEHLDAGEIKITSIIDWQHTLILPRYIAIRTIPFLDIQDVAHLLDSNGLVSESLKDEDYSVVSSFVRQCRFYDSKFKAENPIFYNMYHSPLRNILIGPIAYGGRAWPLNFLTFRESLFRVIKEWEALKTGVPCPIEFSEEEHKARKQDSEEWKQYESHVTLSDTVIGVMGGKVSPETYESAILKNKAFMETYANLLKEENPEHAETADELVASYWIYRPWEK